VEHVATALNATANKYQERLVIRAYLVTEEQRTWLTSNGVSLADVLSGRLTMGQLQEARRVLFDAWNDALGERYFDKWGGDV